MALTDALRELFLIDQQVRGLESRMEGARRHVAAQQTKLDQLTRQQNTLLDQLRQVQAAEAGFEKEAAALDEKISRLREQMNSVKTNKEYSALLVEVNTFKADKAKHEEKALELLTQVDGLKKQVEQVAGQLAEVQKIKELGERDLGARRAEVGEQLDEVRRRRTAAAANVPGEALSLFEKLSDSTEGEAMAPVQLDDPRRMEFTCGGCYMSVPPEVVNRLYAAEKLVQCPSCRRILFLEDSVKEAMGSK